MKFDVHFDPIFDFHLLTVIGNCELAKVNHEFWPIAVTDGKNKLPYHQTMNFINLHKLHKPEIMFVDISYVVQINMLCLFPNQLEKYD